MKGGVRPIRRYEDPIGVALNSAPIGASVRVQLSTYDHGVHSLWIAATDVAIGDAVALDFGFWKWLVGGLRQVVAGWLRRLAGRIDFRP